MDLRSDLRIEMPDGFYLGRIQRSDKGAYLEHFTDPEIARNTLAIPFPYKETDADAWLDQCEREACEPEKNFAIREPSGYLIGGIGIVGNLPADASEAEFGYWLAKSFRGRGIMPRAIGAFTDHIFRTRRLRRLYATPFTHNVASQRVLEKAGFQQQAILKRHHLKNGVYVDAVIYSCTRPHDLDA
jgi:RimJ/RimL family protein N-acetyltransferase